ncbi:MAG: D-alanine--D-alanine ligase family protein [Myxococcota bacterium]
MPARRRLRVLVLTHRDLYARDSTEGLTEAQVLPWRTEFHVVRGLETLGHRVVQLGLHESLAPLHAEIAHFEPHVVFNLLAELRGQGGYEPFVIAALETTGVPFTGCNAEGNLLSRDKALAKTLLAAHDVPVPAFAVFERGARAIDTDLPFPLIVKPAAESGSEGVSRASVVRSRTALRRRVAAVHERFGDAVAERYVEGRELTVPLLGNHRPRCLPVWETFFDRLPEGAPRIATSRLKWNLDHRRALGVHSGPAKLRPAVRRRVEGAARTAWRVLRLSSSARIDFRLDGEGRPFLIDVNAAPDFDFEEDFARSAKHAGMPPLDLLQRLLDLALRYRPRWAD